MSDPKEQIEQYVLDALQAMTLSNGYALPEDIQMTTRDIRMFDQTQGLYPALIIQADSLTSDPFELARNERSVFRIRVIIYIQPHDGELPATLMNAYVSEIRRALVQSPSCGGLNADLRIAEVPTAALWKEDPDGQVTNILEGTVVAEIEYIHSDEDAA